MVTSCLASSASLLRNNLTAGTRPSRKHFTLFQHLNKQKCNITTRNIHKSKAPCKFQSVQDPKPSRFAQDASPPQQAHLWKPLSAQNCVVGQASKPFAGFWNQAMLQIHSLATVLDSSISMDTATDRSLAQTRAGPWSKAVS